MSVRVELMKTGDDASALLCPCEPSVTVSCQPFTCTSSGPTPLFGLGADNSCAGLDLISHGFQAHTAFGSSCVDCFEVLFSKHDFDHTNGYIYSCIAHCLIYGSNLLQSACHAILGHIRNTCMLNEKASWHQLLPMKYMVQSTKCSGSRRNQHRGSESPHAAPRYTTRFKRIHSW